ncbi:chromate efflux transporter [bacterium]|nr:chromate efflux transporter [bacterium]
MNKYFEIFWRFLALGCASFGGPAAHIGYFRKAFVQSRAWLDEQAFARLMALSQFLPGPGSSQLGFAIGCRRGGVIGGLLAFLGFTLPSFAIMVLISSATQTDDTQSWFGGVVQGLKWLAVVVVADATLSMFRSFCQSKLTMGLCVATAAALLITPGLIAQFGCLILAAIIGVAFLSKGQQKSNASERAQIRWVPLTLFAILFVVTLLGIGGLVAGFYQAGSLVFGGGHVVLPLLQSGYSDSVSPDRFLLGYASAQAVPGPMFTLASFLGAEISPGTPWLGGLIATLGIFVPGFLLMLAFGDAWEVLAKRPKLAGAVAGLNAAVVGLLLAALYQPVFVSAVKLPPHFAIIAVGFYALHGLKLPLLVIVGGFALAGVLIP